MSESKKSAIELSRWKKAFHKKYWEGFDAAIEMVDNILVNYDSNYLATMNCWELIEDIRNALIENTELYKKDG